MPDTSNPPAIRMPGMEMPKKRMMKLPPNRKPVRIITMKMQPRLTCCARRASESPSVIASSTEADAAGLITGRSAMTVPRMSCQKWDMGSCFWVMGYGRWAMVFGVCQLGGRTQNRKPRTQTQNSKLKILSP